jgi:ADP-heptose:LPS heptosyltransferase
MFITQQSKNGVSTEKPPNRVLIYRVGHLGDTVIALPALQATRQTFGTAHIALLGNAYVGKDRVTARDVLPKGLIDEWLTYPSNDGRTNPVDMTRLLTFLRAHRFDLLVYLAPRLRRSFEVKRDLAFFRLAGIRSVIGQTGFEYLREKRSGESLSTVEHEADHLLHRLSLSGIAVPPRKPNIDLMLTSEEQGDGERWLHDQLIGYAATDLVGFGAGSKWPSKIWPEERFAEVGRRLIQEKNVYPLVFGGPEDRELANRLILDWGRGSNAAGVLPPRQAAAALSRCAMYVGNDTGTMHLAAAVSRPCVAIMSAQDWPGRWDPYGEGHTVLRKQVPCEGCMLQICEHEGLRCLKEIGVDEVVDACIQMLDRRREPSDQDIVPLKENSTVVSV